jgi:hypothetical protein
MIVNSSEPAKPTPPQLPTAVYRGCPYFGLPDDAATRLLFPAEGAVCHWAKPESEVDIAYQQTTCLTADYESCVVFLRQQRGPLPPGIASADRQQQRTHRIFWGFMAVLVFAVVGIWIGLWWVNGSGRIPALMPEPTPVSHRAVLPTVTAVVTSSHPTAVPATPSPIPTATLTATPTNTATPTQLPTATLPPTYTPRPTILPTAVPLVLARVNVPRLNIRQGPGTFYDAVALIEAGMELEVIGRIRDGSWLEVCCIAGAPGWVIAESVLVEGEITAVPVTTRFPPTPTIIP